MLVADVHEANEASGVNDLDRHLLKTGTERFSVGLVLTPSSPGSSRFWQKKMFTIFHTRVCVLVNLRSCVFAIQFFQS